MLITLQHRHRRHTVNRFLDVEAEVDTEEEEEEEEDGAEGGTSISRYTDYL
jgi:transcription elongation factor SPT5